jgi:lysine/ornithine N-monooxygenase
MATSEQLLQELVDLKKQELKHKSHDRWYKFLFTSLPKILFLIFMSYLSWVAIIEMKDFIQEAPNLIQQGIDKKQEDLTSNLEDNIYEAIPGLENLLN